MSPRDCEIMSRRSRWSLLSTLVSFCPRTFCIRHFRISQAPARVIGKDGTDAGQQIQVGELAVGGVVIPNPQQAQAFAILKP